MESKVFSASTERLIKIFIEEEAKEYPFRFVKNFNDLFEQYKHDISYELITLNDEGNAWVESLYSIIINEIKEKVKDGANRYYFQSLGNAGSLNRQLMVDGNNEYYNWKNPNVYITFCTCGNLSHWGGLSFEIKK